MNFNRKRQHINCLQFVQIILCKGEKLKYVHDTETNYSLKTVAYVKLSDNSVLFQCLALGTGIVAKVTI